MTQPLFTQADLVYSYTRAQAIEDGELIDVSKLAQKAGWRWPVAVTRHVWVDVVKPDRFALAHGESETGRLWDVVWLAYLFARCAPTGTDSIRFEVRATIGGHRRVHHLIAHAGPGDTSKPVITIMFPEDD